MDTTLKVILTEPHDHRLWLSRPRLRAMVAALLVATEDNCEASPLNIKARKVLKTQAGSALEIELEQIRIEQNCTASISI